MQDMHYAYLRIYLLVEQAKVGDDRQCPPVIIVMSIGS